MSAPRCGHERRRPCDSSSPCGTAQAGRPSAGPWRAVRGAGPGLDGCELRWEPGSRGASRAGCSPGRGRCFRGAPRSAGRRSSIVAGDGARDREQRLRVPRAVFTAQEDRTEAPAEPRSALLQRRREDRLRRSGDRIPPGEDEGPAQAMLDQGERGILRALRAGPVERTAEDEDHLVGHESADDVPFDHPGSGIRRGERADESTMVSTRRASARSCGESLTVLAVAAMEPMVAPHE